MTQNKDLRVNVGLSATIPTGQFQNVKPNFDILGINPYEDVDEQVAAALDAASIAFAELDDKLLTIVSEDLQIAQGGKPVSEQVKALREELDKLKNYVRNSVVPVIKRNTPAGD